MMEIPLEQLVRCFSVAVEPYNHDEIEAQGPILSQMRPVHMLTNSV
jgi:hypothetical protein